MRKEIEEQIEKDGNKRLDVWIHLDWAKAYNMQGKIEESLKEGRDFYKKARAMQSPHVISRTKSFANRLLREHKDIQAIKDFYEEINTAGGEK